MDGGWPHGVFQLWYLSGFRGLGRCKIYFSRIVILRYRTAVASGSLNTRIGARAFCERRPRKVFTSSLAPSVQAALCFFTSSSLSSMTFFLLCARNAWIFQQDVCFEPGLIVWWKDMLTWPRYMKNTKRARTSSRSHTWTGLARTCSDLICEWVVGVFHTSGVPVWVSS